MNDKWERIGELSHGDVHYRNAARDLDAVVPEGVEQSIREPLESRLEAYETAVREFVDARIEVGLTTTPEARAAAMVRVEKAFARLRELVPPREGAPTEEDSRG